VADWRKPPTAADAVTAQSVNNFVGGEGGEIELSGGATAAATLGVAGVAGPGAANEMLVTVALSGDALLEFNSGQITSIATNCSLTLSGLGVSVHRTGTPRDDSLTCCRTM